MRKGILTLVATGLACVLVAGSAFATMSFTLTNQPTNPLGGPISPGTGPGYIFMYESFMQIPGQYFDEFGNPFTRSDWFYDYWIENASSQFTITKWYWTHNSPMGGTYGGPVDGELLWDSPLDPPGTYNFGFRPVTPSAMAPGEVTDKYHEKYFDSPCPPVVVDSVVVFEDGHTETWPVYVPECFVPEPGTLLGLASMVGLLGGVMRRRR